LPFRFRARSSRINNIIKTHLSSSLKVAAPKAGAELFGRLRTPHTNHLLQCGHAHSWARNSRNISDSNIRSKNSITIYLVKSPHTPQTNHLNVDIFHGCGNLNKNGQFGTIPQCL
jgi:hypothetical protein